VKQPVGLVIRRAAPLLALIALAALVQSAVAAAELAIIQKNKQFSVPQVTIQVGDRLRFVNEDTVNHNVFSNDKGAEIDILQRPGRADTVTFREPGTFELECAIHPDMKLEVRVTR